MNDEQAERLIVELHAIARSLRGMNACASEVSKTLQSIDERLASVLSLRRVMQDRDLNAIRVVMDE